ncbi:hypothetical protein PHYSODRAFT_475246 [Phytophthora sojae]|uniref:Uncharacterized protein n=1 Tax=Phytophthora sojae (strain P6497) TaxID=1094619 RepID=G4YG89_PHYSP|nr:hypothetical protein PHYSODRAFT_475246 [Phytophthora sojae]EGZ28701.1 hypothetical protein PHYSODRAFT_475246 [Phytophthora sojae]|eukprot:XP_009515976.1 hypothetical protein PHYSODRAFT_475246 [Phytophthora sojae]
MHDVDSSLTLEDSDRMFVRLANGLCPRDDEGNGSDNDSGWKDDLRFIIPIGVFLFLLGCAGLIFLYRRQKKDSEEEAPKEVEKDEPSSLPYVLTMHSVA